MSLAEKKMANYIGVNAGEAQTKVEMQSNAFPASVIANCSHPQDPDHRKAPMKHSLLLLPCPFPTRLNLWWR